MGFLIAGSVLLGSLVGLFYLKNRLHRPWLARLAYSEIAARLALVGLVLVLVGLLTVIGKLFE